MRRLILLSALILAAIFFTPSQSATFPSSATYAAAAAAAPISADLPMFATEDGAQKHCPKDVVVWLNTPSGIYHLKGERWYGRTKHGAYVCKKEADSAGDRETENGQ